jgi:hypothetical protein
VTVDASGDETNDFRTPFVFAERGLVRVTFVALNQRGQQARIFRGVGETRIQKSKKKKNRTGAIDEIVVGWRDDEQCRIVHARRHCDRHIVVFSSN